MGDFLHDFACLSASADRLVKDAHVIAAGDLPGVLSGEAAAQHRRDKMYPAGIVLDAAVIRNNLTITMPTPERPLGCSSGRHHHQIAAREASAGISQL